jgi:hypothetical protein
MNTHFANGRLLTAEEVAARYQCSLRTIHERTRLFAIPHLKHPGGRRNYYPLDWLSEWDEGTDLEVRELVDGGRVVRPKRVPRRPQHREAA